MYQDSIRQCFAGPLPHPVTHIEAAMRLASRDGCLDSMSPRKFVREVFSACRLLTDLGPDDAQKLAWSFGLDR